MTAYDQRAKAQASRMLAPIARGGKGQIVTITTPGASVFDPATDTSTTVDPTTQQGSGVEAAYSSNSIDGTLILAGDKQFLLSPVTTSGADILPPVADRDAITLADGKTWAIRKCDPLSPAGLGVMFTLQLRS